MPVTIFRRRAHVERHGLEFARARREKNGLLPPRRRRLRAHTRGGGAWGPQTSSDAKGLVGDPAAVSARIRFRPLRTKREKDGNYADASGGDSLTWRRRAWGDAHDESSADTLCGSWTRGAGSPQAAWYSWPFGDTNSQRPLLRFGS